jgi:hypothetical protein
MFAFASHFSGKKYIDICHKFGTNSLGNRSRINWIKNLVREKQYQTTPINTDNYLKI